MGRGGGVKEKAQTQHGQAPPAAQRERPPGYICAALHGAAAAVAKGAAGPAALAAAVAKCAPIAKRRARRVAPLDRVALRSLSVAPMRLVLLNLLAGPGRVPASAARRRNHGPAWRCTPRLGIRRRRTTRTTPAADTPLSQDVDGPFRDEKTGR